MTSLFDLDNSSDSEDDFDYEPPADEVSSDEENPLHSSDDEKETKKKSRSKRRNSKVVVDSGKKSVEESNLTVNTVDEKKKADDVYKSFLDEVAADMKESKHESMSSGISCSGSTTSSPAVSNSDKTSCQTSSASTPAKVFEFAGETITVVGDTVKTVDSDDTAGISRSKEEKNVPATVAVAAPSVKRKGLESVLGIIQDKKQKITVLQKSLLDWRSFKKEEGLDQELEKFNRGKGGFIERKRFLERSDVRSYEIERDMRMSKRRTQTKRD